MPGTVPAVCRARMDRRIAGGERGVMTEWARVIALILIVAAVTVGGAAGASHTILHSFAGATGDGQWPGNGLVSDGSAFYGMTKIGGLHDKGTVFSMDLEGGDLTILHSFEGIDGQGPNGGLLLDGGVLYGMTTEGGVQGKGTIFSIGTDGSAFALLHSFAGGIADGAVPQGDLVSDGDTLYGTTTEGGVSGRGTVFSMAKDGGSYTVLYSFAGGMDSGNGPTGNLLLDGTTLYGTTFFGGDYEDGTIYSIQTDGNGYALLHSFSAVGGSYPWSGLTRDGETFYGTTREGGLHDMGTVYSIAADGSGFSLLRSFSGTDGDTPMCMLALDGSTLYGTTSSGGAQGKGTIFSIGTTGGDFTLLHEFAGADGEYPWGTLVLNGDALCGMTGLGGTSNKGTIYSFSRAPEPTPTPVQINFQPVEYPPLPAPWVIDTGDAFGGSWPWGWILTLQGRR